LLLWKVLSVVLLTKDVDINMHLNSRFRLIHGNDVAAMIDQQALIGANYVGVINISGGNF